MDADEHEGREATAGPDVAELIGQPDDAGYRAEAYVEPSGPPTPSIPEPMPDDLPREGAVVDEGAQMGGEAPTG